jgi:hypothetical protein
VQTSSSRTARTICRITFYPLYALLEPPWLRVNRVILLSVRVQGQPGHCMRICLFCSESRCLAGYFLHTACYVYVHVPTPPIWGAGSFHFQSIQPSLLCPGRSGGRGQQQRRRKVTMKSMTISTVQQREASGPVVFPYTKSDGLWVRIEVEIRGPGLHVGGVRSV